MVFLLSALCILFSTVTAPVSNDAATHLVFAREVCHGAKPYVDVADNNWPGFLLVYVPLWLMEGQGGRGHMLIVAVMAGLSAWAVFRFVRTVGRDAWNARLVTLTWLLCFAAPEAALTREQILLLLGSCVLHFSRTPGGGYAVKPWLAWLALGVAFLVKPNFAVYGLLWIVVWMTEEKPSWPRFFSGAVFGILPALAFFLWAWGGEWLAGFWKFGVDFNLHSVGNPGPRRTLQLLMGSQAVWVPMIGAVAWLWRSSKGDPRERRLATLVAVALVCGTISATGQQMLHRAYYAPLLLLGGWLAARLCVRKCPVGIAAACLVATLPLGTVEHPGALAISVLAALVAFMVLAARRDGASEKAVAALLVAGVWTLTALSRPSQGLAPTWWFALWSFPLLAAIGRGCLGADRLESSGCFARAAAPVALAVFTLPWWVMLWRDPRPSAEVWHEHLGLAYQPVPPSARDVLLKAADTGLSRETSLMVLGIDSTFYLGSHMRPAARLVHNPLWRLPGETEPSCLEDIGRREPGMIVCIFAQGTSDPEMLAWKHPDFSPGLIGMLTARYRVECFGPSAMVLMRKDTKRLAEVHGWRRAG